MILNWCLRPPFSGCVSQIESQLQCDSVMNVNHAGEEHLQSLGRIILVTVEQLVKCRFKVWAEITTYLSAVQHSSQDDQNCDFNVGQSHCCGSHTFCGRLKEVKGGSDFKDEKASGINCLEHCFYKTSAFFF